MLSAQDPRGVKPVLLGGRGGDASHHAGEESDEGAAVNDNDRARSPLLARGRRNSLSPVVEKVRVCQLEGDLGPPPERLVNLRRVPFQHHHIGRAQPAPGQPGRKSPSRASGRRSEEHTSELQSPCNLVCRLLLEKKKKNINNKYQQNNKKKTKRRK